jgi:MSHA biogenesis protein MshP
MKTMQNMQQGFSLVTAIFLLVVIAALGVFAVTLSTTQQQSAALDVMGARAYQAARAGIEWGAYQVLPNSAVAGGFAATCRAGAVSQVIAPLPNTLAGFNVNVQCESTAHSEAAATVTLYQLTSTAKQGTVVTPDYVERQMTVTIAQ